MAKIENISPKNEESEGNFERVGGTNGEENQSAIPEIEKCKEALQLVQLRINTQSKTLEWKQGEAFTIANLADLYLYIKSLKIKISKADLKLLVQSSFVPRFSPMKGKNKREIPYLRVGVEYWKRVNIPLANGKDLLLRLIKWNEKTIKDDEGKDILSYIPKYDTFCCVPSHLDYKESINNSYNSYEPLPHQPKEGNCKTILTYLKHIFGEQLHLGLEYFKVLYEKPLQKLPILCLVSKEKDTGKSTMLNLLKLMFGANMTINRQNDFYSQFNSDWANKLLIAVEEALFDKKEASEIFKNLSSALNYKSEGKGTNKVDTEFFGKIIICSNHEDNFIKIDEDDGRYWIRKILTIPEQKRIGQIEYLEMMNKEMPAFLSYLISLPYYKQGSNQRFWFSKEETYTPILDRVKKQSSYLDNALKSCLVDLFDDFAGVQELFFTNSDLLELLKKDNIRADKTQVRNIMEKWGLEQSKFPSTYKKYYWGKNGNDDYSMAAVTEQGRFYTIPKKILFDQDKQEATEIPKQETESPKEAPKKRNCPF